MSSLLDIPAQLALALSLAAVAVEAPQTALPPVVAAPLPSTVLLDETFEGPLRFSERSWLRALHSVPHEAERLGGRVFVTSGGRYYVPSPAARERIVKARQNAEIAQRIARAAAIANAHRLRLQLGKPPVAADLYIAHVADVATAVALVRAVADAPHRPLVSSLPDLAARFARGSGSSRDDMTVEQFYRRLIRETAAPPRLIAVGLKPEPASAGDADGDGEELSASVQRERIIATWRVRVDAAPAAAATQ